MIALLPPYSRKQSTYHALKKMISTTTNHQINRTSYLSWKTDTPLLLWKTSCPNQPLQDSQQ
ncbi:hypothetical protein LZ31DRAFT_615709 [Colletotrichum somersetense]|nr:hypothetical protein LZ31DRAFT_615709 [Colletotrichum somersetense]